MSMLEHYFSVNPDKASSIKRIDLFGNTSVLLWNVYCAIFGQQNLTKLNWSSLGGVNIEEIVNIMDNNMTVQSLDLSNNNDNDAEKIAKILFKNKILHIGASLISESLQNITKLRMSWNNHFIDTGNVLVDYVQKIIGDVDTAKILCKNNTVTKLKLLQNRISENSFLCCYAKDDKFIEALEISYHYISYTGAKIIGRAVQVNASL